MDATEPTKKKETKYFEPTAVQFLMIVCLFVLVLFVSWEIPKLPIFS